MSDAGENAAEDASYLVEVKRSARRRSAAAGEHVRHEGRYRTFGSKALAREWARESTTPSSRVWIQDSVPTDSSPADGYLVGGRRAGSPASSDARGSQVTIGDAEDV